MNELLYGLVGAVGVPLILFLWQLLLKREKVVRWGIRSGTFCRRFLSQRMGVSGGGRLIERLITTVADFTEGLYRGLKGDAAQN